ncbi:MAG: rRNA maturation RNase YbeY [Chloroflexi bacterium]|nr:rRNA maturation RNase YbeY [Chloroflexota bacterium]
MRNSRNAQVTVFFSLQVDEALAQVDIDEARLQGAAQVVLDQHARAGSLSIVIQASGAALNRQHRSVDAPTDVLAFPAASLPEPIAAEAQYFGDIVIGLDYAAARARKCGSDLGDTVCLLVAHATLHLLGYGHETAAERAIMWAAQAEALRQLGIDAGIVARYGGDV